MRIRFPHPFVLLLGGVLVAAVLTWILLAGQYERRIDPATGGNVVVAGTYKEVDASPVGLAQAVLAVPRGMVDGAEIIIVILLVGGAYALLDRTGALGRLVAALVGRSRSPVAVIAGVSAMFATFGALENMHEEIIALVPVLLVLSRGLGFGAITALAMSVGAAVVGAAFGPTNPFAGGIAMRYAELPLLAEPALRVGMLSIATAVWFGWTVWQAKHDDIRPDLGPLPGEPVGKRDGVMLAFVVLPFAPYVYGVLQLDWGFNELSALFLVAGFAVGLMAGFGLRGTAVEFLKGMETMLAAGLFVGVARAISVVLTDGQIIDTIVHNLSQPLQYVPGYLAAALMVPVHAALHVPVPSNSGHAVLTMPIMVPMADLLAMPRLAAVIAYQTGAVLMDMLNPTNGALLAMLLAAGVPYARWLRFAIPGALLVSVVGFAGLALAF
jgi:uncharacterized ion transporter superfamily protein YfcC